MNTKDVIAILEHMKIEYVSADPRYQALESALLVLELYKKVEEDIRRKGG